MTICTHTHTHTNIYAYTHTHTYMYIYINTMSYYVNIDSYNHICKK